MEYKVDIAKYLTTSPWWTRITIGSPSYRPTAAAIHEGSALRYWVSTQWSWGEASAAPARAYWVGFHRCTGLSEETTQNFCKKIQIDKHFYYTLSTNVFLYYGMLLMVPPLFMPLLGIFLCQNLDSKYTKGNKVVIKCVGSLFTVQRDMYLKINRWKLVLQKKLTVAKGKTTVFQARYCSSFRLPLKI